jgi:Na+/H+-dicarboxylate symporter
MNTITEIMIIIVHIIVLYLELNKSLNDNLSKFRPLFKLSEVILTIFSTTSSNPWSLGRIFYNPSSIDIIIIEPALS